MDAQTILNVAFLAFCAEAGITPSEHYDVWDDGEAENWLEQIALDNAVLSMTDSVSGNWVPCLHRF